jgi:two-component system CheB/CheR fusion protein
MQALEAFCNSLPDNPNGAFVVVQHLSPNHRSMMTEILQRQTALPVQEVQNQILLEPAHVYVLPPGKTLFLKAQRLRLEASSESPRYPINRFFQSLVDGWGERIIAILLSGTGQTMGGEIGVHSELRQGATFWFSVPLAIAKFYRGGCKFAKTDDPTRQSADGV